MKYILLVMLLISSSVFSQSYYNNSNRYKNIEFEHDMDRLNDQMDKMDAERQARRDAKEAKRYRENIEYEQSIQRRKRLYGY